MARIEKTVFISYRRADEPWALAIFGDLTRNGYDVFVDYNGIASGHFETVIFENIRARAHFLVLLTPTALKRCADPKDLMRREIEAALDSRRNIVPVMLEGFKFGTSASQLTGKLAPLKQYNGLPIPEGYFRQAMERLRDEFLSVSLDTVLHPASGSAQEVAKELKNKATMALGEALRQPWLLPEETRKQAETAAQHREEERRAASSAAARLIARGRWRMVAGSAIALLLVAWIGLYQMGVPVWVPWQPNPPPADKVSAAADAEAKLKAAEAEQQRLQEDVQRQTKAAADAEAKLKAAEAEQQQLAAAKAEEERKAKAAAEPETKRKADRLAALGISITRTQRGTRATFPIDATETLLKESVSLFEAIGPITEIGPAGNAFNSSSFDLSPLAALTQLRSLDLTGLMVSDVRPLAHLTQLQFLNIGPPDTGSRAPLEDISPLRSLQSLETLWLFATRVSDLKPLSSLGNLRDLNIGATRVADLSPLKNIRSLEVLRAFRTDVSDVSPLAGLVNLQRLHLSETRIVDVAPLAGLVNLQYLHLDETLVTDVLPLASLVNLKQLSLDKTKISNEQLTRLRQLLKQTNIIRE